MSQPLRLSAMTETSNKTCVLCGESLTPSDKEHYIDTCQSCIIDAVTPNDND